MPELYRNRARGKLASSITAGATSLTLESGQGASFGSPSSTDPLRVVLWDGTNFEIVLCTARSTDTLTVTRAQESTTGFAFAAGAAVEGRLTALSMETLQKPAPLYLPEIATPSNPPTDTGFLYAKDRLGRTLPYFLNPGGYESTLAQDSILVVRNETGSTIPIFTPVYSSGTGSGGEPLVAPAEADVAGSMPCIGITVEAIANNANGLVMRAGIITGVNTSGFSAGDVLYVSTTAGAFTTTEPTFPALSQRIARVLSSHASTGTAMVFQLPEFHRPRTGHAFTAIADPATPPADTLYIYNKSVAGRSMLKWKGPSGLDTPLQPYLGMNKLGWLQAHGNATTALSAHGLAATATGTATARNVATTNLLTSVRRLAYVSAATAGSSCGVRQNALQQWRGNGAGLGGFMLVARFGVSDAATVADSRLFVGLYGTAAVIGNVNPSSLANTVYLGCDNGQTTLRIGRNDGTGTATTTDLGANFPSQSLSADLYELVLFAPPNGSSIFYRVTRLNTGDVAEGELTTDLPASTQLLGYQLWRNNGATAAAVGLDIVSLLLETDY